LQVPRSALSLLIGLGAAAVRGVVQPAVKVGFVWWHDPFAAALIGYLISAVVLYGAGGIRAPTGTFRSTPRGVLWFMAVGLCNGGGVLAMYLALAEGDVALVAPLVACYPIFTIALSALILGRVGLSRRLVAGTAVTVAGVVLLLTL
jgi:drug/metabolite transporter (DMT)-like permease